MKALLYKSLPYRCECARICIMNHNENYDEKWEFEKSDSKTFQDGPKQTSGANLVKIRPKMRFDLALIQLAQLFHQNRVKNKIFENLIP